MNAKIVTFQVGMAWIIAICVSLPYVMGHQLRGEQCTSTSVLKKEHIVVYAACWVIIGWGIPLFFILFFSYIITRVLRRDAACSSSCSITLRRVERNRKVFKMLVVIFLAFFLLTTPYSIFYAVVTYLIYMKPETIDENPLKQLNYAIFVLMVANSCINPVIYAKMHKEINKYARKLWESISYMQHLFRRRVFSHHHEEFVLSSTASPERDHVNIDVASPSRSFMA